MKKLIGILMLSGLLMNLPIYGFTQNIALNRPVVTSSVSGSRTGNLAVDGSTSTRWSSVASDPQWIYVDLGSQYNITSVKIIWSSAYGKNYTIDVSNNATSWTTIKSISNNTSLTNTNAVTGTGRYVRIYGTQRGTTSGYSIYELQVNGSLTPCGTPTGLTSSSITTTSATVSWTAVSGAVTYNLQWKASSSSIWTTVNGITATSRSLTGLAAGTAYQFQVQTVCSAGSSSYSTSTSFATTASCGIPTGLNSSSINNTSATVSWTAVPGAVTYNFQWKASSSSTWTPVNGITATSRSLTGLTAGTAYQFQVQTICSAGSSSYSDPASFTTSGGTTGATGKTYYFSSSTGDDSRTSTEAQSSSTPWKTISKLNSIFSTLQGGDVIYFKRGDVFYGGITVSKSGSSTSSPIKFDAYGTGDKPIITGFTAIGSWTSIGSGSYQSVLSSGLSSLNMVAINSTFQPIGRYPKKTASNGGYLTVSSYSGNTSISSSQLSGLPSFTGGQVVIRKNHWIIDKGTVTSQSSSSLSYSGGGYSSSNGFGFFFQNHINACTATGDWAYDPNTKKLTIYYGSSAPPANAVQAATIDALVTLSSRSYISFNNLAFVGSNSKMFYITASSYITINACDFSCSGVDGINADVTSNNITFTNNTAKWTNNNFISAGGSQNWVITGNTITNTGSVAGMGNSGDGNYIGIFNIGAGSKAQYNNIINSGYIAIDFRGSGISVLNNFIDTFCRLKDDGGAIYTFTGSTPVVYSQRTVSNNIVLNGGGGGPGTTTTNSDAFGIYMDNLSSNVTISGNTVANCGSSGIFLHAAHDISVTNNTLYNNVVTGGYGQILIKQESWGMVRNITLTGNVVVSKANTQLVAYYWSNASDFNQWGTFDNNYYCRPVSETNTFSLIQSSGNQNTNLAGWQSVSTKETNSKKSPKTITNVNSLRFEYNATSSNKIIGLGVAYLDAKGISFPSSITLAPYTSTVLITASGGTTLAENTAEIVDESNLTEKPSFTIYPNPVRDNFVLQLNNSQTGKMNVQVVNQAGAIIRSYLFNKDQMVNQVTVPANDLPTGIYFVHVQIGTWSDKRKIVKL